MTWRKALRDVARLRGGDGLRKTYTFYLRDGGEQLRFEPVICRTDAEAMGRAREMLALHSECEAKVRLLAYRQSPLLTLSGPA